MPSCRARRYSVDRRHFSMLADASTARCRHPEAPARNMRQWLILARKRAGLEGWRPRCMHVQAEAPSSIRPCKERWGIIAMSQKPGAFVYMLRCTDGSYYVGTATGADLTKRVAEHNAGTYDGYTSTRRPVQVVWSEYFPRNHRCNRRGAPAEGMVACEKGSTGEGRLGRDPATCEEARRKSKNGVTLRPIILRGPRAAMQG